MSTESSKMYKLAARGPDGQPIRVKEIPDVPVVGDGGVSGGVQHEQQGPHGFGHVQVRHRAHLTHCESPQTAKGTSAPNW